MVSVAKARKEVKKAEALLLNRFGPESLVLAHLARAIQHLLPNEDKPAEAVAAAEPAETGVEVAAQEEPAPEQSSNTDTALGAEAYSPTPAPEEAPELAKRPGRPRTRGRRADR